MESVIWSVESSFLGQNNASKQQPISTIFIHFQTATSLQRDGGEGYRVQMDTTRRKGIDTVATVYALKGDDGQYKKHGQIKRIASSTADDQTAHFEEQMEYYRNIIKVGCS